MVLYRNRHAAAQALIRALQHYRGRHPLVLATPRGRIVIAVDDREVIDCLRAARTTRAANRPEPTKPAAPGGPR